MKRTLRARIEWRIRHHARAAFLRVVGRPVYCTSCGRQLFRVVGVVHNGRLRIIGAAEPNVRVSFYGRETLGFCHLDLDQCPAPERPWVP